jgi:hypothetical protein
MFNVSKLDEETRILSDREALRESDRKCRLRDLPAIMEGGSCGLWDIIKHKA